MSRINSISVCFPAVLSILQKSIRHREGEGVEAASACHGVVVRFVGEVSVKLLLFGRTTAELRDPGCPATVLCGSV